MKVYVIGIRNMLRQSHFLDISEHFCLLSVLVFELLFLVSQKNFEILEINIQIVLLLECVCRCWIVFALLSRCFECLWIQSQGLHRLLVWFTSLEGTAWALAMTRAAKHDVHLLRVQRGPYFVNIGGALSSPILFYGPPRTDIDHDIRWRDRMLGRSWYLPTDAAIAAIPGAPCSSVCGRTLLALII